MDNSGDYSMLLPEFPRMHNKKEWKHGLRQQAFLGVVLGVVKEVVTSLFNNFPMSALVRPYAL